MSELRKTLSAIIGSDVENVLQAIDDAGYTIVPKQASDGLLVSMAMRWDHSFGMDRTELFSGYTMGYSSEMRQNMMVSMRQIHEEVVGTGFYSPDREDQYKKIICPPDK